MSIPRDVKYDTATDRRFRTADGAVITDGMIVWDYNLRVVKVDFEHSSRLYTEYWDGWFETAYADGSRAGIMNGERLCVRHPTTRTLARDRWTEEHKG